MTLSKAFQFSATSLQDYAECPRRFQLRYLLEVAWPAPEAEPMDEQERHGRLGRDFHRLAHQHLLGLPAAALSATVHDADLGRWWQAYLAYAATLSGAQVMPEIGLSTALAGYRLVAQYDALVVGQTANPPHFLIIDWKTYRQRPTRAWLAGRLQTRAYPLVLAQAGAPLNGGDPVRPDQIEMRYWLAEYPTAPETFSYDEVAYQSDLDYVTDLIGEIAGRAASLGGRSDVWPLTDDVRRCRFCNYRSLCRRGTVAGPLAEYPEGGEVTGGDEPGPDFDLDWGQVQEIAY
jgi:predicted RecB family nuclease